MYFIYTTNHSFAQICSPKTCWSNPQVILARPKVDQKSSTFPQPPTCDAQELEHVAWGKVHDVPSGYVNSSLLKMVIEIVDFPIKNGDFQ